MRACRVCEKTDAEVEFYDSITTHCKEHWKARARKYRADNIEKCRERDRQRANLPHRVAARLAYAQTDHGRIAQNRGTRLYIERNPDKRAAHIAVGNAVRDGKLKKQPCEQCGRADAQAHHDDYSKPLDVRWLCSSCHAAHHKEAHSENAA